MSRTSAGMALMIPCVLLLLNSGAVFVYQLENEIVGGSVYFYESIPVQDNPGITWNFKNATVAQSFPGGTPGCVGLYVGRCELYVNGTLRLDRLTSEDEGNYSMTAQYPNSTIIKSSLYGLRVYNPVSDVKLTSNISGVVWPGLNSVSLTCSARGTKVNYSWSLQGVPLPQDSPYHFTENNTVLTMSPVTANDNGTFTCTAYSWINNETSNGINLTLGSGISAVTLTSNTSGSYIWVGEESVSLHCSSDGSNVTFLWKLNGGSLPQGPQYHISSQGDSPPHSNLLISPISKTDAGPFTCQASNPLGNETSNALNLSLAFCPTATALCQTSGSGLGGGEIAGIVLGTVCGIFILEVIVYFVLKAKRKTPSSTVYENAHVPEQHTYERTMPGTQGKSSQESNYEELTHKDKSIYSIMESASEKY
ncbi:cell adhesion molecule CEACAM1-like [Aquarana catesbeiana]|uniref:cell adhesion molecule CEACAM1-like n=1 Tax=Aquarana catesbeiana TaxID=8400 RepID=UPI003CC95B17